MSTLVVPIALWSKKPPSHLITAILLCESKSTLLTASNSGQLCLWSLLYQKDIECVQNGDLNYEEVHVGSNGSPSSVKKRKNSFGVFSQHCQAEAAIRRNSILKIEGMDFHPTPPSTPSQTSGGPCGTISERNGEERRGGAVADLVPKLFLLGHSTTVTCMVECVFVQETTHTSVVVSASEDGVLCVWDLKDGRCLQSTTLFPESPTQMKALRSKRYIVCCGSYPAVQILDVATLEVVHVFRSQVSPDWLGAMCTCGIPSEDNSEKETEALLAVTINGTLKLWSLEFLEDSRYEQPSASPLRVFCLEKCDNPLCMEVNPFNAKNILIVCQDSWKLHTGCDFQVIYEMSAPCSLGWSGGSFLSENEVVVWGVDGNGYLYEIPVTESMKALPRLTLSMGLNHKHAEETEKRKTEIERKYNLFPILKKTFICGNPKSSSIQNHHISLLKGSFPVMSAFIALSPLIFENGQPGLGLKSCGEESFLLCGDGSSKVSIWPLYSTGTKNCDDDGMLGPKDKGGKCEIATAFPAIERTLEGWWKDSWNDHSVDETSSVQNSSGEHVVIERSITATMLVDENIIVQGFADGMIEVSKFLLRKADEGDEGVSKQNTGRQANRQRSVKSDRKYLDSLPCETMKLAGHAGRITCLYHPERDVVADDARDILVSGSSDFTVKLWNLKSGELLRTFSNHSGEITTIIQPPPQSARLRDIFCTVSEDHCVGLYSLEQLRCIHLVGGHAFPVRTVRWRVADEFLIVGCTDGTVYVWQLDTGVLDRIVNGTLGEDILNNCDRSNIYDEDNHSISPASSMEINSVKLGHSEPPLQVFSINVRRLVSDLRLSADSDNSFVSKIMLSYCLAWGMDPVVDEECSKELGVNPPKHHVSYGIKGFKGIMSIMLPSGHNVVERWLYSSHITAVHIISLLSVLLALLSPKGDTYTKGKSRIIDFYLSGGLSRHVPYYVAPSVVTLARYWQDSILDVRECCKWLLYDTIESFSENRRSPLIKKCTLVLEEYYDHRRSQGKTIDPSSIPLVPLVILGLFGSRYSDEFENISVSKIATTMQCIVQMPCPEELSTRFSYRMATVELLGTGFSCWEKYLEVSSVIRNLLQKLGDVAAQLSSSNLKTASSALVLYSRVYQNTLVTIALLKPKAFVNVISADMTSSSSVHKRVTGLRIIRALVRADPSAILSFVPKLAEVTIKSLDPHIPHLREGCMRVSTEGLQEMVKRFNTVSFHSSTQRVAVGTDEGLIVIYDLKTGTRWQVLEGHKSPITSVSFSFDGKHLASFALSDLLVLNWNINSTFLGMLGSSPKCSKTFTVPFPGTLSDEEAMEAVTLVWVSARKLSLIIRGKEFSFSW